MRIFTLERDEDVSGVSGTGTVADGVEFDDGTVVIRWRGEPRSTVVWDSIDDAERVHGHEGKTRFHHGPATNHADDSDDESE